MRTYLNRLVGESIKRGILFPSPLFFWPWLDLRSVTNAAFTYKNLPHVTRHQLLQTML